MTSSAKVRRFGKMLAGFAAIAAAIVACAPSPGASSEHFVITNDNYFKAENSGTILKLGGTRAESHADADTDARHQHCSDGTVYVSEYCRCPAGRPGLRLSRQCAD